MRPKEERKDGAFHNKLIFRSVTPNGQTSRIKQTNWMLLFSVTSFWSWNRNTLQCDGVLKVQGTLTAHKISRLCMKKKLIFTFNTFFPLLFWVGSPLLNFCSAKIFIINSHEGLYFVLSFYVFWDNNQSDNILSCKCHKISHLCSSSFEHYHSS